MRGSRDVESTQQLILRAQELIRRSLDYIEDFQRIERRFDEERARYYANQPVRWVTPNPAPWQGDLNLAAPNLCYHYAPSEDADYFSPRRGPMVLI